ncbi:putative fimbrial subunit PilA [Nitratireductor indicus C115]|uniref:Putative fimbrial subunit PilA n=1 Tax=Nitratireductor indicus C115 TaxID=1231190 RepID=K2NVR2_9HYPH|nr:hypothetical protein [Nitratireductor indicus]EKF41939.1 putative fimbrial subunit PilA [Nitratireductor indicus C115]SFQ47987.1 hypothetical protein SAMN05216176_104180 [Nitratireductor indicus]
MVRPEEQEDEPQEALDPAAERVRRKLVRFMAINLAILFAAVMAVVLAFVYKSLRSQPAPAAEETMLLPGDAKTATLDVPQGARVLSYSIDGMRVSLHVSLSDGKQEIRIYDLRNGQLAARYLIGD